MSFLSRLAKFWVVIVFMCFSMYFAVFNQERVAVSMPPFFQTVSLSLYMVIIAAFLLGATVVTFYFGLEHARKSLEIRRLSRQLRDAAPRQQASMVSDTFSGPSADYSPSVELEKR